MGWRPKTALISKKARGEPPAAPEPVAIQRGSITVVVGLERPFDRHADIIGLALIELRQLHAELLEMERRDLLVEMLGQDIDVVLVLARPGPQLDLRQHLVGEGGTHHETRMAG